ncbi:MAG TPA: hypothetical protein DEB24_01495 [Coriobacteriia bacterium]|nr:hypothetical protein [Coriobacteriia bacterium]
MNHHRLFYRRFLTLMLCVLIAACSMPGMAFATTAPAGAGIGAYARTQGLSENIVNAPGVITKIGQLSEIDAVLADGISSTVLIDYRLIKTAEAAGQLLDKVANKLLVIFVIETPAEAQELATFINDKGYTDTHVASTDPATVKAFRSIATVARGSWIVSDSVTAENAAGIVATAHANQALNVIVPQGTDKAVVEKIQKRLITVFTVSDDTTAGNHKAITSGATGIVTANPAKLKTDASIYPAGTQVRRPFMIAHRGQSSTGPENTLVAYKEAFESGADGYEVDVYITKDGEVILLHDDYFARTTDILTTTKLTDEEVAATGKTRDKITPADLTLEQIKRLDAGSWDKVPAGHQGEPVPTLRELLTYMKGNLAAQDVVLVCELKDKNMAVVDPTVKIIEEMGMQDQVVFISFNDNQTVYVKDTYPRYPVGGLNTILKDPAKWEMWPITDWPNIMNKIQNYTLPMNSTYNPYLKGLDGELINECSIRGMSVWPWTINASADIKQFSDWGATGITTNFTQNVAEAVMGITAKAEGAGNSYTFTGEALRNNRTAAPLSYELVVLEGAEFVERIDGMGVTLKTVTVADKARAASAPRVSLALKALSPGVEAGSAHTLFSQPVVLAAPTVVEPAPVTPDPATPADPATPEPTQPGPANPGTPSDTTNPGTDADKGADKSADTTQDKASGGLPVTGDNYGLVVALIVALVGGAALIGAAAIVLKRKKGTLNAHARTHGER